MLKEHDVVAIKVDLPEHGLAAGDVGAVVHCYADGTACEVDFVDERGQPKGVVTLSTKQLLKLNLSSLLAAS